MTSVFRSQKFRKWSTLMAFYLMLFPSGVPWYWGNLSVYAISYNIKEASVEEFEVQGPWMMVSYEVGTCVGMFFSGVLLKFLPKKLTMVLGFSLSVGGFLGTYFLLGYSLLAMNIVVGLFTSCGGYILNGVIMVITMGWSDGDFGFLNGIVQCGLLVGAIFINQLMTGYVNPANLSPDFNFGSSIFFSQDQVLDRVPSAILLLVGIPVVVFSLCMIMVKENTESGSGSVGEGRKLKSAAVSYGTNEDSTDLNLEEDSTPTNMNEMICSNHPPCNSSQPVEFTPKQIICSSTFYALNFLTFVGMLNYLVLTNYYKLYGQRYINDDHFITNISIPLLLSLAISRPLLGKLLDRFGQQLTFVVYFSSSALSSLGFYFSPFVNRWCYMAMTLVFGSAASSYVVITAGVCLLHYGRSNFLINYTLIMIPPTLGMLAVPGVFPFLIDAFGWFSIYALCAAFSLVGMIVSILCLPRHDSKG